MKKIIVIIVGVLYMATCVGGNFTVVGIATRTSNDEMHDEKALDPQNAQIDIYSGVCS